MAKTNAERQAAYRRRKMHSDEGLFRIDIQCGTHMKMTLERLASYYGVSQKAVLNTLLLDAEKRLVKGLTDAEADEYYDRQLTAGVVTR